VQTQPTPVPTSAPPPPTPPVTTPPVTTPPVTTPPVTTPPVTPLPVTGTWTSQDIGSVGAAGSTTISTSAIAMTASGADIYGNTDGFRYAYQTLNGDGQIIARVASLSAVNPWSKAGIMIRNDNTAGSKEVSLLLASKGTVAFERRFSANTATSTTDVSAAAPQWLKLVRQGNTFTSSISTDGTHWTTVGTTTVAMNSTVEIGVAVTSHAAGVLENASFDNISTVT
jgi:regulation of enolase protein 1 (concanavalin A-like superfamily)